MLTGNIGEWSEPYALLKLLADKKLFIGKENFEKVHDVFYPILGIIRNEKNRNVNFTYEGDLIIISNEKDVFKIPLQEFIKKSEECLGEIKKNKKIKGTFSIPEIEAFLSTFNISDLKAKSKLKNDITIQIQDPNSFLNPVLGFSVKSQLGSSATLVNSSAHTNFIYKLTGNKITQEIIDSVHNVKEFSKKIKTLNDNGIELEYLEMESPKFHSNLQTIDSNFPIIMSKIIELYYTNRIRGSNSIPKIINQVNELNPFKYNLKINSTIYAMMMKRFLTDYALGMRAGEVWYGEHQATGGYLIVKQDGDLICYHFYFKKNFEEYLFSNTRLDTPKMSRHGFGKIYSENGIHKMKLNLQIRFIK